MTREEIAALAIKEIDNCKCLITELTTGFGKTKLAIDLTNHICDKVFKNDKCQTAILILVAKRVHKKTWLDEINKWGGIKSDLITIDCYESLRKHENKFYDIVIADEAHHLNSDVRRSILNTIGFDHLLCLSATMPSDLKWYLKGAYRTKLIRCSLQEAINDDVLPSPRIITIPLNLDSKHITETIVKNSKGTMTITVPYSKRWNYLRDKHNRIKIICTEKEFYEDLESQIAYWKRKTMSTNNQIFRNKWMRLCTDRLKWLSTKKNEFLKSLLEKLQNERVVTFCSSIEQTNELSNYGVNSKNTSSLNYVDDFNEGKINHITSCNILNEGVNLVNCRIGIYANLNASEIITRQRMGRLLRHTDPIVIIPYYKGTREEELLDKMLGEYDKTLITKLNSIEELAL
jgi:superfamily II DNA or RNA helicase